MLKEGEYIQILTTTEIEKDAQRIAKELLQKRLAACVQIIGPITSMYWWKDNIETTHEWLIFIKTKRVMFDEIVDNIKAIHTYETPEIIALPLIEANKDYLKWINNELKISKYEKQINKH